MAFFPRRPTPRGLTLPDNSGNAWRFPYNFSLRAVNQCPHLLRKIGKVERIAPEFFPKSTIEVGLLEKMQGVLGALGKRRGVSLTLPSCGRKSTARICFAKSREDASEGATTKSAADFPLFPKSLNSASLLEKAQVRLVRTRETPRRFPYASLLRAVNQCPHLLRKTEGRRGESKATA